MDYFETISALQITSIVLGAIDLGLTAHSFFQWPDEQFFLAILVITLILNIGGLVGKTVYVSETTKVIDMGIFLTSGSCLSVGGLVMIISASRYTIGLSGIAIAERVLAGSLGIINGAILAYIGFVLLRELQNSIYPIVLPKQAIQTMASNYTGKLQLAIIVVGAIDLGITADSYFRYSEEAFFLAIVIVCFIFSVIELLGGVLGFINRDEEMSSYKALAVAHTIASVLLFSGGILMVVAVMSKNPKVCGAHCGFATYDERLFSAIFGMVNSFLYGLLAYFLYSKSKVVFEKANMHYDWDYEEYHPKE